MKIFDIVVEADEPKDVSARAKLDHSLRAQGHKVVPDKKKELRKGKVKHKGKIEELRDIKIDSTEHEIVVKVGDDKSYTLFIDGKKVGEYHSMGQAKKAISKEIKNESTLAEGPLVVNKDSDLNKMIDTFLDSWKSQRHSDDEYAELLKALGYKLEKDGQRSVITKEAFKNTYDVDDRVDSPLGTGTIVAVSKNVNIDGKVKVKLDDPSKAGKDGEDKDSFVLRTTDLRHINELDEAKGDIRKALVAVAMIATLWGVNKNLAQDAYDASPQLQKLTAYLEVAKEHNDERMIKQLEKRIGDHKMRLDIGKGDVMGADGNPIDVVYDKELPKESITEEQFDEAAGEKDACYHKVKSRYKVWPSAYASGALVKCRKVGAKNWGNKSKKK